MSNYKFLAQIKFYNEYSNSKGCYTLLQVKQLFETAQLILGKNSELFERFVNRFWKNFYR